MYTHACRAHPGCTCFCCTTVHISHNYTCISSLWCLPPLPSSHLSRSSECKAQLPVLYSNFSPDDYFTHGSVYMSMLLSPFIPLFPSPQWTHGDLTSLAPHERLPEILVVPREPSPWSPHPPPPPLAKRRSPPHLSLLAYFLLGFRPEGRDGP